MNINLAVPVQYTQHCQNVPQGMNLNTYINDCFNIVQQDADCGIIRIEDLSEQISFYDVDTDLHQVFVNIFDDQLNLCFSGTIDPFSNISFVLPKPGCYLVEIDVRYTIQYDNAGEIIPHTFQNVYGYPIEWRIAHSYHNALKNDITSRIAALQCEINKRRCVGRSWSKLYDRVIALDNYLFAICTYCLTLEQFDQIACKVKTIKKVC